ncbi:MAG: hypothetical protein EXR11_01005 [Rhodospirillaceae bacterium]|nr:hypothetical protein [Rhodospirillaceae bacterium]
MDPANAVAEIQRLAAAGDFIAADTICRDLITSQPDNPGFWQLRGNGALVAKDFSAAQNYFERVLAAVSDAPRPWLGLAQARAGQNDPLATEAAEHALALGLSDDDTAIASGIIATGQFQRGDLAGGKVTLSRLLDYYKKSARFLRLKLFMRRNQRSPLRYAPTMQPSPSSFCG